MYGQIHVTFREYILLNHGQKTWEEIVSEARLDDRVDFLVYSRYSDDKTYKLIKSAGHVLKKTQEEVLSEYGESFIGYCLRHGYDKMLKTLGSDMWSFIQNLDSLHSLLALSYKNITPPSFRCETGNGCIYLHYYSVRKGLYPLAMGLVRAVGRDIFQQKVDITVIERSTESIGEKITQHTIFKIILHGIAKNPSKNSTNHAIGKNCKQSETFSGDERKSSLFTRCPFSAHSDNNIQIPQDRFCDIFPYHVIFNNQMSIVQCGSQIMKLSSFPIDDSTCVNDVFNIVHPKMQLTFENINKFINSVFFLKFRYAKDTERRTMVTLKGQMIWLEDSDHMMFMGSPRLTSLNELMKVNIFLSDIPLYDVTREMILFHQMRRAEIDIAKKLDETTAELKKTSKALEKEKEKTDLLLYQMLPQKVAHQLKNGKQVEAEKYDQVTILFSDIVTFTNISAACSPLDIVNMLNDLYQRFDEKTNQHGVYKVETIGDAYMVVCGIPEPTTNHAAPVAKLAIDMLLEAAKVKSPATGKPLQIRVGIHTGPVVAGVVGVKMPRYCLFGDTVNTASRMESHGLPDRIHITPTTFQALKENKFYVKERGEINVKGKGRMTTYFLVGIDSVTSEPEDEFTKYNAMTTDSVKTVDKRIKYFNVDRVKHESQTCVLV